MSLTGNYEAAFELTEEVVRDTFKAAWRSGEIPHELRESGNIAGIDLEAIVKILQTNAAGDLDVSLTTSVHNGIKMTLPLDIEVKEKNVDASAAPSINPVTFQAGLEITAPAQTLQGTGGKELVLNLVGLPDQQVEVKMPAAPVVPVTEELIEDGIHKAYDDGVIPHSSNVGTIAVDIVDDDADSSRQIQFKIDQPVTIGSEGHGTLSLPVLVHFAAGLELTLKISKVGLIQTTDQLTLRFAGVTANDVEIVPALPSPYNNDAKQAVAANMSAIPDYPVFWPSNDSIKKMIRDRAKQRLDAWGADGNGRIHIFTPNSVENSPISIVDFDVSVQPGFLAVLFNPMAGADPDQVKNFIPSGKKFAQMLDAAAVLELADEAIEKDILQANGCGGWPCKLKNKIEGHWVKLDKPSISLHDGYMKISGSSEVEVDCWFDPNPNYEAKVDFSFAIDSEGNKYIKPRLFEEDVDLSCMDWFLGIIIPIYGWICLAVISSVVDSVGGRIVQAEGDKIASGTKYLAGEIHGVGSVETELDQIEVLEEGLVLSGGQIEIDTGKLTQGLTASQSGSPYVGFAGTPITLQSAFTHANAKHTWEFGDGKSSVGSQVKHTYIEDGIYIATLETGMNVPNGVTTHHFSRVKVKNAQPIVEAGPDITVNEGDVISFIGYFTDPEWVDKHKALWGWGDKSCEPGMVSETNDPPKAKGVVAGKHAYCDNGVYTVKLWVVDDDGGVGVGTREVTVRNVPPTVDAGDMVYAYRCVPINMIARFIDPGWCDTHTATWDFGDCSPCMEATVREVNQAPIGYGIAIATHTYNHCGRFLAECTVIDDDGGVGRATVVVQVTGVKNADFEGGFRWRSVGEVANDWEPYPQIDASTGSSAVPSLVASGSKLFHAEEFVVHDGQRSQRIAGSGRFRAGILQQIGANKHWDYQLSVWYHLDENFTGKCRLGIDPSGGGDPGSSSVVWKEGSDRRAWRMLTNRVTAAGGAITVFLEAETEGGSINACFDQVVLEPYPCPLPKPVKPEMPKPKPQRTCVDWSDVKESSDVGPKYTKGGFRFESLASESMQVVRWGAPSGQGKLLLVASGIAVSLPFAADRVFVQVLSYDGRSIRLDALNASGKVTDQTISKEGVKQIQTLELASENIVAVKLTAAGRECILIELCISQGLGAASEVGYVEGLGPPMPTRSILA